VFNLFVGRQGINFHIDEPNLNLDKNTKNIPAEKKEAVPCETASDDQICE
jgi:hypothetical protein